MSRSWRKYKASGAFRRKIIQNMKVIMKSENVNAIPSKTEDEPTSIAPNCGSHSINLELEGVNMEKCADDDDTETNWLIELQEEDDADGDNKNQTFSTNCNIENSNEQFRNNFKYWANTFNIRHRALKYIMNVVNMRLPSVLPKDPRTLLETPHTRVNLQKMNEGYYWHQGLDVCLKNCFHQIQHFSSLSITINIDGLPIYKSSKDEFWPILFNIFEIPYLNPMVIGIYSGKGKPPDIKTFITPFVEEMKIILKNGILFDNGHLLRIKIRCFICDSPARSFIKGVANFNGQHGCLKCTTIGEYSYVTHCNVFPRIDSPKRTDDGFRSKIYGSHHKCGTPLEELPIDMIEDFPIADSLHLLDLGIMKRCLVGWRDGTFRNFRMKWSANDTSRISQYLKACRLPSEIHRSVRGLECLAHWKGLEYRSFLYYISIVVLKNYLPYDVYEHFLLLFCAITICSSAQYLSSLGAANQMLYDYIEKYIDIYGKDYVTSNVHNLVHVVDDVKRFGTLSTISAYPFENKLYHIKNMLRQPRNALAQVAKRLFELSRIEVDVPGINQIFPTLHKENDGEGVNLNNQSLEKLPKKFYSKVDAHKFVISNDIKNKWFLTSDETILCVKNIIQHNDNTISIYGCTLKYQESYFQIPINSAYLSIYKCDEQENPPQLFTLKCIKCKMVALKYDTSSFVFIPLLHTL